VAEVVVVVEVDAGSIGAGMVVEDSRVVVVEVTGGVEEQAATSRAAEQQRASRRMAMFFISWILIEEFGCGTSGDCKSGE
jgi:hypothetical protein